MVLSFTNYSKFIINNIHYPWMHLFTDNMKDMYGKYIIGTTCLIRQTKPNSEGNL